MRAAASVVAWALLPGAIAVARRVPAGPETDALVASQLWLENRVPLVAAPEGRRQRAGEHTVRYRSRGRLKRPSGAERRTVPTDKYPEQQLHEQVSPNEELSDVLSWGERVGSVKVTRRSTPYPGAAPSDWGRPSTKSWVFG